MQKKTWFGFWIVCILFAFCLIKNGHPIFLYNLTDSVPVGLYFFIETKQFKRGDVVAIRMQPGKKIHKYNKNYVMDGHFYLKQILGLWGDFVCRFKGDVYLNGEKIGSLIDVSNIPNLRPQWEGCISLGEDEFFLFSEKKRSFDSRYFGVIKRKEIDGGAKKVF